MKRDATWRELLSSRLNRDEKDVLRLYRVLLEGLDTPVSLGCHLRLKYGGIPLVLEASINPRDYLSKDSFLRDSQAIKFLSKYPFKDESLQPRQAALKTLFEGEASCEKENRFWMDFDKGLVDLTPAFREVCEGVQDIIADILGPFPVEEWLDGCRFGPGASAFLEKPKPSDADKLYEDPCVTHEFLPYARAFLRDYPGWTDTLTSGGSRPLNLIPVQGGKHASVPKSALTDRNIETQPALNIFAQLGLGLMIRRRLKSRCGIDLDHGQEVNRELARRGSIDDSYSTVDLKNASDTISREVVRQLLPRSWLHALDVCRTTSILLDGEWRPLQRFSAMGNGFTFELESLLFYAIARQCAPRGRVVVFGDDIIVPSKFFGIVTRTLALFGFQVNRKKSYDIGPFRESCGADWFEGAISRPFQLVHPITNIPEVIGLLNGLARAAFRSNQGFGFDRRYRGAWLFAARWINPRIRARIAWGLPQDDTFLFAWRFRGDRFVVTTTENRPIDCYYKGKATALYRVYASRVKHDIDSRPKSVLSIPGRASYHFVPGDPFLKYRDWGAPAPLGVVRMVHELGWV